MNTRSAFVLDTREVGRRPGLRKDYVRQLSAPALLGLDMIGVPEGTPLELSVRLESVTEGVLATGRVTGELHGECGRCLSDFTEPLDVDFVELYAYPNSATDVTTDDEEVGRLKGDHLDLEPVVRDVVVLSLPLTPLCGPDCQGLCPGCGERLDDLPADHSHTQIDPRWAALTERFGSVESTD
ncbi:YceD family protein [Jatrophihabitans telluris]|uniref:YceD family protein n=1 Tax=Jatrophihabitans telluris TaxID=2038343 RepID=A0ABY4R2F6_9ACTN|nr:YceD family protein [Jatrophihabitans telluris]UQX89969.1 YceD family protein [Jatrophihabitans telluris]